MLHVSIRLQSILLVPRTLQVLADVLYRNHQENNTIIY